MSLRTAFCISTTVRSLWQFAFHQLVVYSDDVNIETIEKKTETLIGGTKEVGLELNAEKTKYML
jgi:hypothetical protein